MNPQDVAAQNAQMLQEIGQIVTENNQMLQEIGQMISQAMGGAQEEAAVAGAEAGLEEGAAIGAQAGAEDEALRQEAMARLQQG